MACSLGAQGGNFCVGQYARRLLGGVEDAVDEGVVSRNLAALEPKKHVGLAAHGTDLDDLLEAEQMRGHAAIDGVGEIQVAFVKGFNDGRSVGAGGRAEGACATDWIVRRD